MTKILAGNLTRATFLRVSLVLGVALGAASCSTIEDLDPTGLIGGSSDSAPDSQFPPDAAAPAAPSDADAGTTPDLASLPARPVPSATPGQQAQTAQSLAADGAQARYSADQLRGGTEAAAPPPAANEGMSSAAMQALAADNAPPTAAAPPPAQAMPAPAPAASPVPAAALVPTRTASLAPPPGAQPAVPANTPVRGAPMMTNARMSDAELGFRPSAAPPLDPSINQFVSAPIVARYRQTASNAGSMGTASAAVPAVPARRGQGGPEMSGAVVANLDAISTGPIAAMNGGAAPTAVIYFPGDGTTLSPAARAEIRAAANAFKSDGGQGTVRVVGHASSRTANMAVEKHLELIFNKSQSRANAVAQALIREGVPAAKVLVEAVGDSQPVYYESMPRGEDGNRRAEIFVQS